jgi:hypothetical protein
MDVSQSENIKWKNASKGVDENVWKVHTVTCAREEPSQEEERGKSPIQLFVRVL